MNEHNTYQMYVKEINVVCSATEAELKRKLTLKSSLDKHDYNALSFTIPQEGALSMLGSGDEVKVTVEFVRPALEVELLRQAELDAENDYEG